jgi:hypothetical protein
VSVRWSCRAFVLLSVTGVLILSAVSVAGAAGPPVLGLHAPAGDGDLSSVSPAVLAAASAGATSAASAAAPWAASADASGCRDEAAASDFHEKQVDWTNLPLEQLPAGAVSVPTWSGSFTTGGTAYPYTMVGTDPAAGSVVTNVPVELIPLRLDFQGNCVLQDSSSVAGIEPSPLFTPADFGDQYLDLFQRANFWSQVSTASPGWQLLLDPAAVPAVTLHVPASQGLTFSDPSCDPACGIVSGKWLTVKLLGLLGSLHISPATLAVFVPVNTYVTDDNPENCLTGGCGFYDGFHDAVVSPKDPHAISTYVFASYVDDPQVPAGDDFGSSVLSHEILEWANDPFVHEARVTGHQADQFGNLVPAWTSSYYQDEGFTCQPFLEVADPLEGLGWIGVPSAGTIYALADGAFLSWFARQSPSTAVDGLYDLGGVFTTYATAC